MTPRLTRIERRRLPVAAAVLYALITGAAAFEHHDLLCHLQHPQHCTACTASQLGSDPQALAAPRAVGLPDAGVATTIVPVSRGVLLPVRSTERAPPSRSLPV